MRTLLLPAAVLTVLAASALAQTRPPHVRPPRPADAPRSIGKFDDWQAATRGEAGEAICYAFTRAASSTPAVPGRGDVVMTVTQRGHDRDVVALSAGFAFATGAEVQVTVDKLEVRFYTRGRSAFSGDGHALAAAFTGARQAVAKSPGRGGVVTDTFSLRGFQAAYAAINRACPPR